MVGEATIDASSVAGSRSAMAWLTTAPLDAVAVVAEYNGLANNSANMTAAVAPLITITRRKHDSPKPVALIAPSTSLPAA